MPRKPSSDEQRAQGDDEIRNPRREGDIDEIGAAGGEGDLDLDTDDEDLDDDEMNEDEEIEDEDVG